MVMPYDSDGRDDAPGGWVGSVDLGPLAGGIGFALRRAQAVVADDFAQRFGAEAVTANEFALLTVLRHNPGLRQSQASFALGIQRANFVPLLDGLARRGWAERRPVPGDRRAAALFLTREGVAALDRLGALARGQDALFRARVGGEADYAALLTLLHRVSDRGLDLA